MASFSEQSFHSIRSLNSTVGTLVRLPPLHLYLPQMMALCGVGEDRLGTCQAHNLDGFWHYLWVPIGTSEAHRLVPQ